MRLYVYHADEPNFRTLPEGTRVTTLDIADKFRIAAVVEVAQEQVSDALEAAYELTNHIDKPWWENKGVTRKDGKRSTSVGDLIFVEHADGREEYFSVASVGFNRVHYN